MEIISNSSKFFRFLGITFLLVNLSACGGSGGSDSTLPVMPPPVPPPAPAPPPNQAPVVNITVSEQTVFEGRVIIFSFDGSTDSDGYIDTYEMTQSSGTPATRLSDQNLFTLRWLAPLYSQDITETLSFEAVLTDDKGLSTRQQVDVTVEGLAGPGVPVARFMPALKLELGNGTSIVGNDVNADYVIASVTVHDSNNVSQTQLKVIGETNADSIIDFGSDTAITFQETFEDISYLDFDSLGFTLTSVFADDLAVLSEQNNKFWWLTQKRSDEENVIGEFTLQDSFNIPSPCYSGGRVSTGEDFIWVGQRDLGFSTVSLEPVKGESLRTIGFNHQVTPQVSDGRSFCHIYPTRLPTAISLDDSFEVRIPDLIAIDYDAISLSFFADTDRDGMYEDKGSMPLIPDTPDGLQIIEVIAAGSPSSVPRQLFILVSDGDHMGNHYLVIVTQDNSTSEPSTRLFSWEAGVPIDLLLGNFGGSSPQNQFIEDLVVVRSTSNTSLFFDNIRDPNLGVATPFVFAEPIEFFLDRGAGSAVAIEGIGNALEAILVSYPETGIIQYFTLEDDFRIYQNL